MAGPHGAQDYMRSRPLLGEADKENVSNVDSSRNAHHSPGGKRKTSWLSALVAETPKKPAALNPRIVLQNAFLVETCSPAGAPGSGAPEVTLQRVETRVLDHDSAREATSFRSEEHSAPNGLGQASGSNAAESVDLGMSSMPSEAREYDAHGHASTAAAMDFQTNRQDSLQSCDPLMRACSPKFTSPETPRSSGARSSAANAWLSSQRGDWYCSSARAKAAAASIGLSPMPLEDLLALPVPPLFLAADQQERLRNSHTQRSAKSDAETSPSCVQSRSTSYSSDNSHRWSMQRSVTPNSAPWVGGNVRNDFAQRPDTIWKAPARMTLTSSGDDAEGGASRQHNDFAAAHNDFAAAHARRSLPTPRVLSPRPVTHIPDHQSQSSESSWSERQPQNEDNQSAPEGDAGGAGADGVCESEFVTGCLRLSAPPSLGFLLGDGRPVRTDAPTPALARKAGGNAGERGWTSSKDGSEPLDALEASMLLDNLCKRAPGPTASRAPLPPARPPVSSRSSLLGCDFALSSEAANQQIADDIARRCVFEISPRQESTKLERKSCPDSSALAVSSSFSGSSPNIQGVGGTSSIFALGNCRDRVSARSPVVPQLRLSECGLGGAAGESEERWEQADRLMPSRVSCVSPPKAAVSEEGTDGPGAAEIRRVFVQRSEKLQEMARGVKEATDLLAEAAAERRYEMADRWSQEVKERRASAQAFAEDLLRELGDAERAAVTKGQYAAAQACKHIAVSVQHSVEGLACSADTRDPIAAVCRKPGMAMLVLLDLAQQRVAWRWGQVALQSRRRMLSIAIVAALCLSCSGSLQAALKYAVGWMWLGAVTPLQWEFHGGRQGYQKALVSHACSFASASPSTSWRSSRNVVGSSGWRSGGDRRSKERAETDSERDGAEVDAPDSLDGSAALAILVRHWQFVVPFVLVALGASLLEAVIFTTLRLSLAQEWGLQGSVQMTMLKYAHMTLVFVVSLSGMHPWATLLTFALPLSAPFFLASNVAGKLSGALLQAAMAWALWVRDPDATLSKWIQQGDVSSGGWAGVVWRVMHTALVPLLSQQQRQNIAELEGTCRGGSGEVNLGVPVWVADGQAAMASALVSWLPVAVTISVGLVALCRVASVQMSARGSATSK